MAVPNEGQVNAEKKQDNLTTLADFAPLVGMLFVGMLEYSPLMSILPSLLRSLVLTGIFSFLIPIVFIGLILATLALLGHIPHLEIVGIEGVEHILRFLAVFGSGSALRGVIVISSASTLVGVLFDAYALYRYQSLKR
jgi:hypothetical protein